MKKLCIFDFDGTIFDSITDVTKCFNMTFEGLDLPTPTLEEYKKSLGGNVDEIIELILGERNSPENIKLVKSIYNRTYNEDKKENTKTYEGVPELLRKLQSEGYILAINSNRTPESIKYYIIRFLSDINFIDIQGDVPASPSKPDPYGVNTIIDKAKVSKNETIYIGDSKTDVETAKNAGVDCILVRWGYGVGDVYDNEYILKTVDNAEEIEKIIKEM